jgi:hypothetical protein
MGPPQAAGFVDRVGLACSLVGLPLCCLPWIRRVAWAGPEWLKPGPSHGPVSVLLVLAVLGGLALATLGIFLGMRSRRRQRRQAGPDSRVARWALYVGLAGLAAAASYEVVLLLEQFWVLWQPEYPGPWFERGRP